VDDAPAVRIADELSIAVPTVRAVLRRVRARLGVALRAYRLPGE
jgi:DNA-binding CsgD family transcriptional regulator